MTGAELRAARERRGISREVFADLIGGIGSEKQIKHWEDTNPPEYAIRRICEVLDMPSAAAGYHQPVRTASGVRFGWKDMAGFGTGSKKPAGTVQKRSGGHFGRESSSQIRNEEGRMIVTEQVREWVATQKRVTHNQLMKKWRIDDNEADELYAILKRIGLVGHMGYVVRGDRDNGTVDQG